MVQKKKGEIRAGMIRGDSVEYDLLLKWAKTLIVKDIIHVRSELEKDLVQRLLWTM